MLVFNLIEEQEFNPTERLEKKLGKVAEGDFSVACWEPGQSSTYHAHPHATEIYFCFQGGGTMVTPEQTVKLLPGTFVVHPPGELHEYTNGPERTLLFRIRYGIDMTVHQLHWKGHPEWKQSTADREYFEKHPPAGSIK